jgi:hypothetical protein
LNTSRSVFVCRERLGKVRNDLNFVSRVRLNPALLLLPTNEKAVLSGCRLLTALQAIPKCQCQQWQKPWTCCTTSEGGNDDK